MIATAEVRVTESGDRATKKSVRVAYVMSRFPKLTETFILLEMLAIQRQGDDVSVYPLQIQRKGPRHSEVRGISGSVHDVSFASWDCVHALWDYARRDPARLMKTLWSSVRPFLAKPSTFIKTATTVLKSLAMARDMERRRIDHIHSHFATYATTSANVIHRLTGIPFSFTAHAHDIDSSAGSLADKVRAAEFVVAISDHGRREITRRCGSVAAQKVVVIRNGVDGTLFAPGDLPSDCRPLRILCVAALEEKKGQLDLIGACRILRDRGIHFCCELIGDGPERARLADAINDSGLNEHVVLAGAHPRTVVAKRMRTADVVVLPSVVTRSGKTEGLPVALTEALACERPVVATRVAGVEELVVDGVTGLLVNPGDPEAIALALSRLAEDPDLRRRLGRQGRLAVLADYDPAVGAARLHDMFVRTQR